MILQQHMIEPVIPDLRNISLERLAELGDTVLADSIMRYRHRLEETGPQVNAFTSNI